MDVSFDAGKTVEFSDAYAYKWPSFSEAIKFNIGSTIIKKGKPKNKRVKTRVKSKKNIIPLYKKPLPPVSFKIYEGPRLFVPSTISLTHSEKLKFDTVNLYNPIKRGFSNAFFDIKTKYTFRFHNDKSMAFLRKHGFL